MAAMLLSGLSATAATRTVMPRRAALRARAGQSVQMKSMGASKRSARLAVASAVPTPGAAPVRYASARPSPRVEPPRFARTRAPRASRGVAPRVTGTEQTGQTLVLFSDARVQRVRERRPEKDPGAFFFVLLFF